MSKKKAGIVAAASAAALLALSPLAFAGDQGWGDGQHGAPGAHGEHGEHQAIDKHANGAVSGANGNNISVPITACNNDVVGSGAGGAAKDVKGSLAGAGSLTGDSKAKSQLNDEDNRSCGTGSDAGDNR